MQRRRESKQNTGHECDNSGEAKHTPIQAEINSARFTRREEARNQIGRPESDTQSRGATKQSQEDDSPSVTAGSVAPRLAPRAKRIAISRRRDEAQANSKLATFAHAISSTKPTTTSSNVETSRTPSCCLRIYTRFRNHGHRSRRVRLGQRAHVGFG